MRVYAVGDVHGRSDLLAKLLSQIDIHLAQNPVAHPVEVFLGDYVDRGPDSRGVIDLLIRRRQSRETICLKGNHETYILEFLTDPKILDVWRQYGGFETLLSYGLKPSIRSTPEERKELARSFASVFPDEHLQFLSALPTSYTCGDFFFSHAGVQPGIPLDRQTETDLLWIRDDFLLCEDDFGKYVVHGHTPVREPDLRANRVNIDTGAFATGRLTCLVIEGEEMQVLPQGARSSPAVEDIRAPEIAAFVEISPTVVPVNEISAGIDTAGSGQSSVPEPTVVPTADERHSTPGQSAPAGDPPAAREKGPGHNGSRRASTMIRPVLILSTVAVISTLTVRGLWPNMESDGNSSGKHDILARSEANEDPAGVAQAGRSDGRVWPKARLRLQQDVVASSDGNVPLGAEVSGEQVGLALEITGLPAGVTISAGRSLGAGGWRIPATDVANATIRSPQGFAGTLDLRVELRLADDTIVDRGALRRHWRSDLTHASNESIAVPALSDGSASKEATNRTPTDSANAHHAVVLSFDRQQIDFLIGRSQQLISEGDVQAARILLRRAAEARDARAALALGATYDPIMLAILKANGMGADVSLARNWYEKAREFGSLEAQQRLNVLVSGTR